MDSLLKKYGNGRLSVEEQARLGCLPETLKVRDIARLWHQEQQVAVKTATNVIAQAIHEGRLQAVGETPRRAPDEILLVAPVVVTRLSPWLDWDRCPEEHPWGEWWNEEEKPGPVSITVCPFVEWPDVMVHFQDFRHWLEIEGVQPSQLPETLHRWVWSEFSSASQATAADTQASVASKRDQQIEKIMEIIGRLEFPPKKIPYGGKAKLRRICCDESPRLFTTTGFDHAWKEAKNRGLVEVEGVDKYKS